MMRAIKNLIFKHKIISVLIVAVIAYGGYRSYKAAHNTANETRYVTAAVQKGALITSVTGSGQVSVSNQLDIKPKVSGDVVFVAVTPGQTVKTGALIAELDAGDAQKTVRDAQVNLKSAELALQKLKQPADELSLTQSHNTLAKAQDDKQNAESDLTKTYDDGFTNISNSFLNLPTVITGLKNILYGSDAALGGANQWNMDFYAGAAGLYDDKTSSYKTDADQKYQTARAEYDQNIADYKATTRSANTSTIVALINETYQTSKDISESVKSASNLIQFYEDTLTKYNKKYVSTADTHLATLGAYTTEVNTILANLLNTQNTIKSDTDTITNSDRIITEDTQSLAKLQAGADPLDIQSSQLTVTTRQNALKDAEDALANYYIHAPFDGIITTVNAKKSDSVGSGTALATIITNQKLAQISLNEVDVAKIKNDDKATLTFDAIDGLSIAGQVAQIDTVGTVTQGVVTYNVHIAFDTQDERVKPGMSVSAAIITDVKQDVLVVPNSAVKTQGGASYVNMFDQPLPQSSGNQGAVSAVPPRAQTVQTGLSNDRSTEIVSGLNEGDQIVTRTIQNSATPAPTTAPSLFGGGGGARGGGGAGVIRIPHGN